MSFHKLSVHVTLKEIVSSILQVFLMLNVIFCEWDYIKWAPFPNPPQKIRQIWFGGIQCFM